MANGTTKKLWAIDPGVRYCGLSRFENRELVEAIHFKPGRAYNAYHFLNRVGVALAQLWLHASSEEVIIEFPVNYDTGHQKGDQKDIRNLAAAAASIGGTLSALAVVPVYYVEPSSWKGQVPKVVMLNRIWSSLSDMEQHAVDLTFTQISRALEHGDGDGADVLDSVGLGLFRLQRLNKNKIRTNTFSSESVG